MKKSVKSNAIRSKSNHYPTLSKNVFCTWTVSPEKPSISESTNRHEGLMIDDSMNRFDAGTRPRSRDVPITVATAGDEKGRPVPSRCEASNPEIAVAIAVGSVHDSAKQTIVTRIW